jgi:hypothetical protein
MFTDPPDVYHGRVICIEHPILIKLISEQVGFNLFHLGSTRRGTNSNQVGSLSCTAKHKDQCVTTSHK